MNYTAAVSVGVALAERMREQSHGAIVALSSVAGGRTVTVSGQFVTDGFAVFMKWLVLIGSALTILMSLGYNERERMARFEYPVLVMFATVGMFLMVSANDLISLYVGLELQSLALYVVAAFQRDSLRSSEAGLKYFVLGALSSGMKQTSSPNRSRVHLHHSEPSGSESISGAGRRRSVDVQARW